MQPDTGQGETEVHGLDHEVSGELLADPLRLMVGDEVADLMAKDGGETPFVLGNRKDASEDHHLSIREEEGIPVPEVEEHHLPRARGVETSRLEHTVGDSPDLLSGPRCALWRYDGTRPPRVVHDPQEVLVRRGNQVGVGDEAELRTTSKWDRGAGGKSGGREAKKSSPCPCSGAFAEAGSWRHGGVVQHGGLNDQRTIPASRLLLGSAGKVAKAFAPPLCFLYCIGL